MILNCFCENCGFYNLYYFFILIENNGCLLNGLIFVVKVLFEMVYIELIDDFFFVCIFVLLIGLCRLYLFIYY